MIKFCYNSGNQYLSHGCTQRMAFSITDARMSKDRMLRIAFRRHDGHRLVSISTINQDGLNDQEDRTAPEAR